METETINPLSLTDALEETALPEAQSSADAPLEIATGPKPDAGFKAFLGKLRPADWIILITFAALYSPMFYAMYVEWTMPEAPQAYGLLTLPASLALAWLLRGRAEGLTPRPALSGFALLLSGLLITLFGSLVGALTITAIGFGVTVAGAILARYGGLALRRFIFPVAFLVTLIPLPHELMNSLTFQLQQLSVQWAAKIMGLFGEAKVDGTRIHLSSYTLDVIAPCSGLTIILPLMVLAAYYLYIVNAPLWKKLFIFGLTIPVALIVNALRIALIGMVGETISAKAAAAFHDYSGLITLVCGFAALILVAQEMRCNQISDEIAL